jgi:hypothetical protein
VLRRSDFCPQQVWNHSKVLSWKMALFDLRFEDRFCCLWRTEEHRTSSVWRKQDLMMIEMWCNGRELGISMTPRLLGWETIYWKRECRRNDVEMKMMSADLDKFRVGGFCQLLKRGHPIGIWMHEWRFQERNLSI